jgi:hypothetical protein
MEVRKRGDDASGLGCGVRCKTVKRRGFTFLRSGTSIRTEV